MSENKYNVSDATPIKASAIEHDGTRYELLQLGDRKALAVTGNDSGFAREIINPATGEYVIPLTSENAAVLRSRLPWLNPVPFGKKKTFGFGDRLGTGTPGHIEALRAAEGDSTTIAPIFAQQSVRENTRIGRTPQEVMDAATWGIFESGWREPWGADADHCKEIAHIAPFVAAGYTFYTIDPSDHVDNDANHDSIEVLRGKVAQLQWSALHTGYDKLWQSYSSQTFLTFTEEILLRALVKYGRAIIHTATMAEELRKQLGSKPFDLEMSVDETDTPTTVHEHFFIANELTRLQIPVVSVAPRFVGKFQKGVDYIGDLAEFEQEFIKHADIMKHFSTYKMSIHTGSDKFSLYPIIAKHAGDLVHVKTAGTSYLEALRIIARNDAAFFRRILTLSRERFEKDRKSYFLDAQLDRVPVDEALSDQDLPGLLDQFDARQVLHVAFGSVLDQFRDEFHKFIVRYEKEYAAGLKTHFLRHLTPFAGKQG